MSDVVRFSKVLFPSEQEAIRTLRSVGGQVDERLTMDVEYPEFGRIRRLFAIFGNVVELKGMVSDSFLVDRMSKLLEEPDNAYIYDKLEEGRLKHTPFNKRTVRKVVPDLLERKLHVPWAFKMMNFDFGMTIAKVHKKGDPFDFATFYSEMIKAEATGDGDLNVNFVRLFSLPIGGSAQGTWHETISDEMLDEDIALVLEADVRL